MRKDENLVLAAGFHPMRGHVADGTRVKFQSGEEFTVRSTMRGWKLLNETTRSELGPFDGAQELTAAIVRHDHSSIGTTA